MNVCTLGTVCEFINGGAWSDKEYSDSGYAVLKVSNCKPSGYSLETINYLPVSSYKKYQKNELRIDDVIIATVGSHPNLQDSAAGRASIVTEEVKGFLLNQNAVCIRVLDEEVFNQKYLGYIAKSAPFQHYIQMRGRGAANQMRIAIGAIKEYQIDIPSLKIQKRIADILSAYDDLIENNQRQIKLLEEAAMRLYKEWFVDFRFPGHETTTFIDGLPEGWTIGCAESFYNMSIGKTPPRSEPQCFSVKGNGTKWVSIADMGTSSGFIFKTAETIVDDAIKKYGVKIVPENTLFLSFKLTVGRVSIATEPMCTNEAIAHFRVVDLAERDYLYLYLKNFSYDTLGNTSSISKAVNSKIIKSMNIIMPNKAILKSFSNLTTPIMENMRNKSLNILRLQEARDRLLPKLLNGEIEV